MSHTLSHRQIYLSYNELGASKICLHRQTTNANRKTEAVV